MAGMARVVTVAAVLCVSSLSVLVTSAASAPPDKGKVSAAAQKALKEIAGENGYKSWAAFAGAREAEAARFQKEAARIIADALTYGRRVVKDYGTFDGGLQAHGITEYVIDFNAGEIFLRTGFELIYPDGTKELTTSYWRGGIDGKLGQVTTVTKDGIETVTRVTEWVPGSIDLKPGDSRPAAKPSTSAAGQRPSSLDPKKDGSLGSASGGSSPLGGILDAVIAAADAPDTVESGSDDDPAPASGEQPGGEPSSPDPEPAGEKEGSKQSTVWGPASKESNGSTYQAYEKTNEDGSKTTGTKTTTADGTVTCRSMGENGEQEEECPSGMTDEPNCRVDCERLTFLAGIFCFACDLTSPPPFEHSNIGTPNSGGGSHSDGDWAPYGVYVQLTRPGGPLDYGNPADPNAADAIDWGDLIPDPRTDGNVDPVEPGVESTQGAAEFLAVSVDEALLDPLRDPVHAPGTDDNGPAPAGDSPGDAEHHS